MINADTAPKVENFIAEMRELSEAEQRSLAAAVLQDRKLEAFVEELDDHLSCERSSAEGSLELFTP
ncbi:MAG TPA: hypothetical protein VGK82_16475 [Pyrinomonadaceae bacterium]